MNLFLILGNQLFDPVGFELLGVSKVNTIFFMREDRELASYYRFHKHKLIFFFSAMRAYRDELVRHGYTVHYEELSEDTSHRDSHASFISYEDSLAYFVSKWKIRGAFFFEIEDKFFETRIASFFKNASLPAITLASPMFLTSRSEFKAYLVKKGKPFMKTFYEMQRKRLARLY
jgi:deoxyribodipyrimidine photolyase-related protein